MPDPQRIPIKPRVRVPFYVLAGLVASGCLGVFIYREGGPGRQSAAEVAVLLAGTESARVTFFRLQPIRLDPSQLQREIHLHGWKVLGHQPLRDSEVEHLRDFLRSGSTYGTDNIHCFQPGMGIRFETEARVLDLVICLNCQKFLAYDGLNEKGWNLSTAGCARFAAIYEAHAP
jgi:hypothetical protein